MKRWNLFIEISEGNLTRVSMLFHPKCLNVLIASSTFPFSACFAQLVLASSVVFVNQAC